MVVDLNVYRNNKEIIKELLFIRDFFNANYADKSWGWVGLTALLFAELAIETYLNNEKPDPEFYPALKGMLWEFHYKVNKKQLENSIGGKCKK